MKYCHRYEWALPKTVLWLFSASFPPHPNTRAPPLQALTPSFNGLEPPCAGWLSSPLPPSSHKGPILASRPLTPKWTSLDFLWVMAGGICGTLSPSVHLPRLRFLTRPPSLSLGIYSLSSRTRTFNHERNTIAIPPYPSSSALDGSREPRRDVDSTGEISTGWLTCTEL